MRKIKRKLNASYVEPVTFAGYPAKVKRAEIDLNNRTKNLEESLRTIAGQIVNLIEAINQQERLEYNSEDYGIGNPEEYPWFDSITDEYADTCYKAWEDFWRADSRATEISGILEDIREKLESTCAEDYA